MSHWHAVRYYYSQEKQSVCMVTWSAKIKSIHIDIYSDKYNQRMPWNHLPDHNTTSDGIYLFINGWRVFVFWYALTVWQNRNHNSFWEGNILTVSGWPVLVLLYNSQSLLQMHIPQHDAFTIHLLWSLMHSNALWTIILDTFVVTRKFVWAVSFSTDSLNATPQLPFLSFIYGLCSYHVTYFQ